MKILYVLLTVILLLFSSPAQARISSLSVAVDGMACPFCAFGVEKRLKTVTGVSSVTVDMKTGMALVNAKPAHSIDYQKISEAVKDAGFTAGDMVVTVDGRIAKDTLDTLVLHFNGSSLVLQTDSNELNVHLNGAAESSRSVVLKGQIFLNSNKEWILRPEVVKEVKP